MELLELLKMLGQSSLVSEDGLNEAIQEVVIDFRGGDLRICLYLLAATSIFALIGIVQTIQLYKHDKRLKKLELATSLKIS